MQGNDLDTQRTNLREVQDVYVTHFVGNIGCGQGLQSVFLYTDLSELIKNGESFDKGLRGISISANVVKFNKYISPINISDTNYPRTYWKVIKDEKNAFTVVKSMDAHSNSVSMSYHTISTLDQVQNQFILVDDLASSLVSTDKANCKLQTNVPVTFFHTDILCHLGSGLYFAKHEDNGDMTVGNITLSLKEIIPNTVHTVRQSDTNVPLCKLKPFTMVETLNKGIIVVCSVVGDNSKFVMIRTDKTESEAIETLELDYLLSELRVYENLEDDDEKESLDMLNDIAIGNFLVNNTPKIYSVTESNVVYSILGKTDAKISESTLGSIADATLVDLEMDIDGNIMFLLERKDGNSYCVCTKYLMP